MVLDRLDLVYWLIWLCQITAYRIINCCLFVCVYVDCHTGQYFCLIGQWSTQLMQFGCIIIIVSVGIIVFCVQHCLSCG